MAQWTWSSEAQWREGERREKGGGMERGSKGREGRQMKGLTFGVS